MSCFGDNNKCSIKYNYSLPSYNIDEKRKLTKFKF